MSDRSCDSTKTYPRGAATSVGLAVCFGTDTTSSVSGAVDAAMDASSPGSR